MWPGYARVHPGSLWRCPGICQVISHGSSTLSARKKVADSSTQPEQTCVSSLCPQRYSPFSTHFNRSVGSIVWVCPPSVKQTCSRATRHWLQDARKSSGGLLLHVVVLPVQVVRCSVEGLVKRRWKMLLLSGVATIVLLVGAWCGGQFVVSVAEGVWRMLDIVCMVLDYLQAFHVS